MRARLIDPKGPLLTRIATLVVPVLLLGLCAWADLIPDIYLALIGTALYLFPLLRWRRRPREVEIALGPGFVEVSRAGSLNQRIRGRSVTGASTAFLTQGVGLVLQHEGRPIALELREDRDADAVRDALGIGHHGFGKVAWGIASGWSMVVGQWVGFGFAILCVLGMFASSSMAVPLVLYMMAMMVIVPVMAVHLSKEASEARVAGRPPRVGIELEPRGVILREPFREIPYGAILDARVMVDARVAERGIVIVTEPREDPRYIHVRSGAHMTADERAHCVAQIIAGARRARGLGPREPLVSGQIEELARGAADARGWLLRLDAAAQQMASGAGYRGSAVDTSELWAALENHEADEHVRAAAARLLVRSDKESRKRIQAIAESTRDRITERRIRVVLEPDIDEASHELDELDRRRRMTRDSPGPS